VTVHRAHVVIAALGGRAVAVEIVGELLVHINDQGIFPCGIVTGGIEERALEALATAVLVLDKFFAAPSVVALERVCFCDRLGLLEIGVRNEGVW